MNNVIGRQGNAASFFVAVLYLYLLSCGPAALYFNYQTREQGFIPWLVFGEVVPTLKGLIWPYYAFHYSQRLAVAGEQLNAEEERRFSDICGTLTLHHPDFDDKAVADARSILKAYEARTGQLLTKAAFQDQVGWTTFYLEWKAELSASVILSRDSQKLTTTPRYDALSARFRASAPISDEVRMGNGMLAAAGERQESFPYEGQQIPMARLRESMPEIESHYREMQSSFDRMVNALADLLR